MYENVPTVSTAERQQVLQALERLQAKLVQKDELTHNERLGSLRDTLQSPLLGHILTLQHSIKQLKDQLNCMPPDTCSEFGFSRKGQLIVSASHPASSLTTSGTDSLLSNGLAPSSAGLPLPEPLQSWLSIAAKGRQTEHISLAKPVSGGLGFSVVGRRAEGVFIRQVQPGTVAQRDGRLAEKDQILVINGTPLDQSVTQQQAISLLHQPGDRVDLVVARDPSALQLPQPEPLTANLTEQWGHQEEIELVNDGSGLGFGIVGGKATGVVVRTLVPNSVAHKDGRLRTGDHILRIGETPTQGLASDQVVKVLQACGSCVRMLIARDPFSQTSSTTVPPPPPASAPVTVLPPPPPQLPTQRGRVSRTPNLEGYEIHEVPLAKKKGQSLGISIIGYNALTSEDAVGVFVKHVVPGSAADQSGNIRVHDRLLAVDGVSLQGFTNHEVLEVMKQTGQIVHLTLVRRMALERCLDTVQREPSRVSLKRSSELRARSSDLQRNSVMLLGSTLESSDTDRADPCNMQLARGAEPASVTECELRDKWEQALGPHYQVLVVELDPIIEDDAELQKYSKLLPIHTMRLGVELDSFDGHHYISSVASGGPVAKHGLLRPEDELLEVNDVQLYGKSRREAVAFLREVPPPFTLVCCRHLTDEGSDYQPDQVQEPWREPSPAAANLDEIELKLSSLLASPASPRRIHDVQDHEALAQTPADVEIADAPLHNQGNLKEEEQEKEEEEEGEEGELALWSPDIQVLELEKGTRGLGFSILDYQDPVDPQRCVIVIRSLVPGGVAERQGGLLPGDQLVFVNHIQLNLCSLDQAVEVLKAAPVGTVLLGIRKPLMAEGNQDKACGVAQTANQGQRMDLNLSLPPATGLDSTSTLSEEHEQPQDEDQGAELILDGGLPRYISPLTISLMDSTPALNLIRMSPMPLSPGEEREMAVDEEEGERGDMEVEGLGMCSRKVPPSWVAWEEEHCAPPFATEQAGPAASKEEEEEEEAAAASEVAELNTSLSLGRSGDFLAESRDSEADSELALTDTDTESVHMIDTVNRKRRRQGNAAPPIRGGNGDLPEREEGEGEETPSFSHWGPPRRVEVWQEPGESLGISIVGGRSIIKRLRNGEELKGIFIKQVLADSPSGRTHLLKTGDKILQVSGVDLQNASHEEAVQAIKAAPSPVVFIVQSLSATPRPVSLTASSFNKHKAKRKSMLNVAVGGAPPPVRVPPPYQSPSLLTEEKDEALEEVRGRVG